MSQQSPVSEEQQLESDFSEWRALFNQYRNNGMLPPAERERFRALSGRLTQGGYFKQLPSTL